MNELQLCHEPVVLHHMTVHRHVFLTGPPGVGKSTIVQAVLGRLAAAVEAFGFVTIEQTDERGERFGFQSVDVADRSHIVQLASLDRKRGLHASSMIGPFHVNLEAVAEFCQRALYKAISSDELASKPRLIVMDEIGAMQLLSSDIEALFARVTCATSGNHCFGTIPADGLHALPFVEAGGMSIGIA